MVDAAAGIQLGHLVDDRPVAVRRRADDELHGHPRDAARPKRVRRQTLRSLRPVVIDERSRLLERLQGGRETLLGSDSR